MKRKSQSTLTISAVAFIAAFIVDFYLIMVYPSNIGIIIAISLIVIVDTYFLVDGILAKIDEIASINIDKQNELTKVEKGIYSVAKREEASRAQNMSALLDMMLELKEENSKLFKDALDQDKLMTSLQIKKENDNTTKVVNSTDRIAVLLAQMATANASSQSEALEILNGICKELEVRNEKTQPKDTQTKDAQLGDIQLEDIQLDETKFNEILFGGFQPDEMQLEDSQPDEMQLEDSQLDEMQPESSQPDEMQLEDVQNEGPKFETIPGMANLDDLDNLDDLGYINTLDSLDNLDYDIQSRLAMLNSERDVI